MIREDTDNFLKDIRALYPRFYEDGMSEFVIEEWHKTLKGFTYAKCSAALSKFFKDSARSTAPLPANLISIIVSDKKAKQVDEPQESEQSKQAMALDFRRSKLHQIYSELKAMDEDIWEKNREFLRVAYSDNPNRREIFRGLVAEAEAMNKERDKNLLSLGYNSDYLEMVPY